MPRHRMVSSLVFCLLLTVLVACGNPFGDSQSTRGPGDLAVYAEVGAKSHQAEWSTDPGFGVASSIDPVTSPWIHGVEPGQPHYYRVRAVLHSEPTAWTPGFRGATSWTSATNPVVVSTQEL